MSASLSADRAQQQLELLGVAAGLLGGADVGLGHDLHQRRAGAVEVDEATRARRAVGRVPWTSLAVSSSRCARVIATVNGPSEVSIASRPSAASGMVVLADLVALRQVRVEVVLALPLGRRRGRASIARPVAITNSTARRLITGSAPGRPRQTGQTWVLGGGAVVGGGAAAEHLGRGPQLAVDLDADDGLVALRAATRCRRQVAHAPVSHRAAATARPRRRLPSSRPAVADRADLIHVRALS